MKKVSAIYIILITLLILLVAACSQATNTASQPTPAPTALASTALAAEGRIVPREDVYLSFFASGQVSEILVKEGDLVKAGQVVARLGNRAEIEASIANIKVELLAAQQARQALFDNIEVARAAVAREISAANRAVRDAQYTLDNYTIPANQQGMTAEEAVMKMKEQLDQARTAFEEVKGRPSNDPQRQQRKEQLDNAQSDYNAAIRRLEYETALREAQTRLEKAMRDAQRLASGPDPDQLAASEARLAAAEAALRAAEAALANLELKATIDGTVVEQKLLVGQTVTAGQPVMRIVDFSQMYVETSDLTELEVVAISLGDKAVIRPDALPAVTLNGTVEKIADVFEEKRGDITYTVRLLLENTDPRLRWGMTVVVTFEE